MQPSPSTKSGEAEPLLEVIENVVPPALHKAAWEVCSGKRWYFGHGSKEGDGSRFWKMDLDGDATFDAIWEHVRPRCEALAGAPLRVIRQYANGHTYGLGGQPHLDDQQPGAYTLLYYPNPEWKDGWDGETVYYDQAGEIALAVRPRPNRAVFFDSGILHAGRAPSRLCPALRVTVAYKLQAITGPAAGSRPSAAAAEPDKQETPPENVSCTELAESRDGASRVYRLCVASSAIDHAVEEHLTRLGSTLRLPGFRPGKIPMAVLEQRYGTRARADAVNRIAAETTQRLIPKHSVVASFDLRAGAASGDLEFDAKTTYLPDLPAVDFSTLVLERLSTAPEDLQAARLGEAEAASLLRNHLKLQVLDQLDAAYHIPLLPLLIERELAKVWQAAEPDVPASAAERESVMAELRAIAERRVRLGAVVAEIARRNGIEAQDRAELENKVVDFLVAHARVQDRKASLAELRELAGGE